MEFTEFTRMQIKDLEKQFKQYYSPETQIIGLTELKIGFKLNKKSGSTYFFLYLFQLII